MSTKVCSVPGCGRPAKARGWCHRCYKRWLKHGDPTIVLYDISEIPYGTRFGRLFVYGLNHVDEGGNRCYYCRCDCKRHTVVDGRDLKKGHTQSCGCFGRERAGERVAAMSTTHGMHATGTYSSWQSMVRRCTHPSAAGWEHYGGADPPVLIHPSWMTFENFLADMGVRPEGTSLGRFGDVGNYEPGNCAWQTDPEQRAEAKKKRANLPETRIPFLRGTLSDI